MPPKKSAASADASSDDAGGLNETELKFVQAYFETLAPQTKDAMDWDALQAKLGFQSVKTVKNKFRILCQKHKWCEYAEGAGSAGAGTKKRAADAEGEKKPAKTKKTKKETEETGAEEA
ncbi:hypothetical protein Micbo1qcDRAFT_199744 [Microdochium bolleyi]|uniref:Myb-like domain-containing protein n=1 Tax=Microdochium bolleyi TaxID=196109 RepID=A0A136JIM7_9PEZI|nr:hypothetical protein Micbo1qcDRAFT_199744 [Microdochium bolleyi]